MKLNIVISGLLEDSTCHYTRKTGQVYVLTSNGKGPIHVLTKEFDRFVAFEQDCSKLASQPNDRESPKA